MSSIALENKTILVTGAAGFIGSNLVKRIYQETSSATVIGIDNMNAYYDVALKEFRLKELDKYSRGIGIIFVVLGHTYRSNVFQTWIYSFHIREFRIWSQNFVFTSKR